MGWNRGYTIFEKTVIGAYDLGVLDDALLCVLMEPYRGSDIDSGGSRDLTTKDGLSVEEVVIAVLDLAQWAELNEHRLRIQAYPPDMDPKEEEDHEAYYEARWNVFYRITRDRFGWG